MTSNDIPELERITFFPGQRLLALDLTEMQDVNRQLRWLHNRSLHAWGIGLGLGVTGEAGDSAVVVSPGYGIDCIGREIILSDPQTRPIPAVAGDVLGKPVEFFLVAAYRDDDAQQVEERRDGVCLPEGAVRLSEQPVLEWRKRDALKAGYELVLAQVLILNCRLNRPVSIAARRSARPSQNPFIAAGQTVAGRTPWTTWQIGGGPVLGVTVKVDTSSARFRSTPRYMTHIVGDREIPPSSGQLAIGFPSVTAATPEGFILNVLLPDMSPLPYNPPALRAIPGGAGIVRDLLRWSVTWMGIEA